MNLKEGGWRAARYGVPFGVMLAFSASGIGLLTTPMRAFCRTKESRPHRYTILGNYFEYPEHGPMDLDDFIIAVCCRHRNVGSRQSP
jgi:hypothetical protein